MRRPNFEQLTIQDPPIWAEATRCEVWNLHDDHPPQLVATFTKREDAELFIEMVGYYSSMKTPKAGGIKGLP